MLKKKPNGSVMVGAEDNPHATFVVNGEVLITSVESIKKSAPAIIAEKLKGVQREASSASSFSRSYILASLRAMLELFGQSPVCDTRLYFLLLQTECLVF